MNDDARPVRRRGIELRHLDGRYELTDGDGAAICQLNETAVALWELCDGATAVSEMSAAVAELFGLEPAQAGAEVRRTLEDLAVAGVVEEQPRSAAN